MANKSNEESEPKEKTSLNMDENAKLTRKYDLVEPIKLLYVKLLKARNLPEGHDYYVQLKLGNVRATTLFFDQRSPHEWNQVFAFEGDKFEDPNLEVWVKDKVEAVELPAPPAPHALPALLAPHTFMGRVQFNVFEVPTRVPPESPFAPQWYKLEIQVPWQTEDSQSEPNETQLVGGDIMMCLWMGNQTDEHFPNAWCSNCMKISTDSFGFTRSKVYISPTLWYLRVNIIEADELALRSNSETSDIFVQVYLGTLRLRTNVSKKKSEKPFWNEDLMFVAEEPFSDTLALSVEQGSLVEHVSLGRVELHLKDVDKSPDGSGTDPKFYNLNPPEITNLPIETTICGKINARIFLDGSYHVMDEPIEYSSDFNPTSRDLWKPSIGVLELGILKACDLAPMKGNTRSDAYCVAKYGAKWVRTRTVVDSLEPKWNEQYIWEVYEPCTVITIAIFDNNQLDANDRARGASDAIIGKVRIRLSTLEQGKVYTHSYPIISLQPKGVKKMGEIHLAIRFTCNFMSSLSMCKVYMSPLLPENHYFKPLSIAQCDNLRNQAAHVIAQRLSRTEPSLRKEVVYYILDVKSEIWSMRKGIVNFNRIMSLIGDFVVFSKWLQDLCHWKSPITTILFHFLCTVMVLYPEPLFPLMCFFVLWIGIKRYSKRPMHCCHIDAKLCGANVVTQEDIEEELDLYPTQLEGEPLRRRYDRLRFIGWNIETVVSDLIILGERLQSLSNWRDPRATMIFLVFCVVGFFVTVFVPAHVIIIIWITYYLRHPRYRSTSPSIPKIFIKRMPSKQAFIL